ncbi:MAG: TMEM43 family protein [Akkermansia sp.]|nr:TMEM43 family protein [Akkermansia sp.]
MKRPSLSVLLLLTVLLGCCAVFFRCGLMPERYFVERPEVADLSALHAADAANEGKLVYVCDTPSEDLPLEDRDFGFTCRGLSLKRRVLYYQWTEVENELNREKRYERRWVESYIPATSFAAEGYHNAAALPQLLSLDLQVQPTPVLNGLETDAALLQEQWTPQPASLQGYEIPGALRERSCIVAGNTLYVFMHPGGDPQKPEVGDMMIQWLVQPLPAALSCIGMQKNGRLVPAAKPAGYQPELFAMQPEARRFGTICADLDKRGEASDRAFLGGVSFLFFLVVYLLRPAMGRLLRDVGGMDEKRAKLGCLTSIGLAMLLMMVSYQAGKFVHTPEEAWPYVVIPAAVVVLWLLYLNHRRQLALDAKRESDSLRQTEAFLAGETDTPALPSEVEEEKIVEEEAPPRPARAPQEKSGGCAKLAGLLLLLLGGGLMVGGEIYAFRTADALADVRTKVRTLSAQEAPQQTEGPVCITGTVLSEETLRDTAFGVEQRAVKLERRAYVRQWEEILEREVRHHRRRRSRDSDADEVVYHYRYDERWVKEYIDSSTFRYRKEHTNRRPIAPELGPLQLCAADVRLGSYTLSDSVLGEMEADELLPLTEDWRAQPNLAPHVALRMQGGVLELRSNPAATADSPADIGDRRFAWTIVPEGREYTVLGALKGTTLTPWAQEGQAPVLIVKEGPWTAEELLHEADEARFYTVIGMRTCYIAMLLAGLWLIGLLRRLFSKL